MMAPAAMAQNSNNEAVESVIVTGTHVQGMTAADSAAPIAVVGADALTQGTGMGDLRQGLGATVPSFTAQQYSGSFGGLALTASLRGLNPNEALVMVNGHRRHYSGMMHFYGGSYDSGSTAADLSLIPEGAIDHVEVLLDGAAAQYGTDAIAGVINIILKKNPEGGEASLTGGEYYNGQGETYDMTVNKGLSLGEKGFVNVTFNKQFSDFTQYGGPSNTYINAQGQHVPQNTVTGVGANGVATLSTVGSGIPDNFLQYVPNYPYANNLYGNPQNQMTIGEMNAAYDFNDNIELYAYGTIGHKAARSHQTYRGGNVLMATEGSNQPCSASNLNGYNTALTASGAAACAVGVGGGVTALGSNGLDGNGHVISSGNAGNLFSSNVVNVLTGQKVPSAANEPALGTTTELVMYPGGFQPMEGLKEDDYQYNIGLKFNDVAGWAVDINGGYGRDIDRLYTLNSGNESLFLDTHTSPVNFYDGSFTTGQFTGNIDATREFNVGLASPLTVAAGAEAREDYYAIGAGDPTSYYGGGAQSRPGFLPSTASKHSRKNYAGYIDLAVDPIENLQIDLAGRFEHYTDFGDTQIGKITARYDINPEWAIRGTISTGFRAPTLAEEFYTNTSVSPTSANVQLPANSASAKLLGFPNLAPESSVNYSVGIVAHPIDDLSLTVDAYSIAVGNRITVSSTISAKGGAINAPGLVNQAIALEGITLDPLASQQGVTAFLNAFSSHTRGVDLTANYFTDFRRFGSVNWTVAGNFNETAMTRIAPIPEVLQQANPNASFFTYQTQYAIVHSTPNIKLGLTANWSLDDFGITLRETLYGPQHGYVSPNSGGELIPSDQASVGLFDLEARYNLTDQLQFAIGGDNLFNIRPDTNGFAPANCSNPDIIVVQGGSCAVGPNKASGQGFPADNGSTNYSPIGTAWNPNGGYYYARISFNF